jgi:hypothetical protein
MAKDWIPLGTGTFLTAGALDPGLLSPTSRNRLHILGFPSSITPQTRHFRC